MLIRKSIAGAAATTAGLALVVTGALAPAAVAAGKGSERGQERSAAAHAAKDERAATRGDGNARAADRGHEADGDSKAKAASPQASTTRGRSADAPHGKANGHTGDRGAADRSTRAQGSAESGPENGRENGRGDERGNGHTPVTVCHATGNGGFVEITFDENALEKHLENHMKHMADHQDFVVEPGTGCDVPAATQGDTTSERTDDTDDTDDTEETLGTTAGGGTVVPGETGTTGTDAEVLGVQALARGVRAEAPAARGAEVAGATAMPAAGPMSGVLPQTGAAPMALAAAAGAVLLGAGATTLAARRRREA